MPLRRGPLQFQGLCSPSFSPCRWWTSSDGNSTSPPCVPLFALLVSQGVVEAPLPNPNLHQFDARLFLEAPRGLAPTGMGGVPGAGLGGQLGAGGLPLTLAQLLPQATVLRNTRLPRPQNAKHVGVNWWRRAEYPKCEVCCANRPCVCATPPTTSIHSRACHLHGEPIEACLQQGDAALEDDTPRASHQQADGLHLHFPTRRRRCNGLRYAACRTQGKGHDSAQCTSL